MADVGLKGRRFAVAIAVFSLLGLTFNIWMAVRNQAGWSVDYNQFYSASRLAGTGHLYDWEALRKVENERGVALPTGRLPVVIYGHKLLGGLPYEVARPVWLALIFAALMLFAVIWPGAKPSFMIPAVLWSIPAMLLLLYGQDEPFFLLFFAAGLALTERKRPWMAGVAFSLCICKFHLTLGILVMLVAQRRWKTLIAGAAAGLVLVASNFLIEGAGWPLAYLRMSQIPQFSPTFEVMPNLYAIASRFPWPKAMEVIFAVTVLTILFAICRRGVDIGMAGAAALACGLLVGHHALAADTTLLIPLSVLTIQRPVAPAWLKAWGVAMLSPVPMALLFSQRTLVWQIAIAGFVVAAMILAKTRPIDTPEDDVTYVPRPREVGILVSNEA